MAKLKTKRVPRMTTVTDLPVTAWKRDVRRRIAEWNQQAWTLIEKIIDAQLVLGDLPNTITLADG